MLFYYVQIEDRDDSKSKQWRKSKCSECKARWGTLGRVLRLSAGILVGRAPKKTFRSYFCRIQIDLNVTKIIAVKDYICTKTLMWMEVPIYNSINAKSQADNIWVKDMISTQKEQIPKKISQGSKNFMHFATKFSWGPRVQERVLQGSHIYLWEHMQKVAGSSP